MAKSKVATKPAPKAKAKPAAKDKAAVSPKPARESWITAYFCVKNPEAIIAFYKKAFGFEEIFAFKQEGKIVHAEFGYRGQKFMFGPESPECSFTQSPTTAKTTTFGLYVFVDDVDAFIENARKNGAKVVQEPKDQFYGDRTATVIDPEGHVWTFGTHKFDFDPTKAQSCCAH
jgi:PhnB protein